MYVELELEPVIVLVSQVLNQRHWLQLYELIIYYIIQSFWISVRMQYNVTVRYGYHTRILRPRIIQSYAPNFTPPILRVPKYNPKPGQ